MLIGHFTRPRTYEANELPLCLCLVANGHLAITCYKWLQCFEPQSDSKTRAGAVMVLLDSARRELSVGRVLAKLAVELPRPQCC